MLGVRLQNYLKKLLVSLYWLTTVAVSVCLGAIPLMSAVFVLLYATSKSHISTSNTNKSSTQTGA